MWGLKGGETKAQKHQVNSSHYSWGADLDNRPSTFFHQTPLTKNISDPQKPRGATVQLPALNIISPGEGKRQGRAAPLLHCGAEEQVHLPAMA